MRRKNYIAFMAAGMLVFAMPITGLAEENYNVWMDEADMESDGQDIDVDIKTDGSSTDGLLVINYDASVLQVDEEDIVWSDDVEMYSANIVQEGTLKIAYLSEDIIEEGVLATIKFTTNEEDVSMDAITVEGDVHDGEGNKLNVGKKAEKTEEGKPSEKDKEDVGPTEDGKEAVGTGDGTAYFPYAASLGIGAVCCKMTLGYKMKGRKE